MRPAIRVDSLAKQYHIGTRKRAPHRQLREVIMDGVRGLWGRLRGRRQANQAASSDDTFWALKDVSFEVQPGEVVGIIGRNGAGKSTLLKVLSRITEPTLGRAEVRGRMGSLLEVGTGFHPELTGRENIYLNGSILGMTRKEIDRKFDEIVAFSDIERFLDMPVKRYSSGMYVRLAFAVAANLEPEILIVDEVLAVGDAAFQEKCMGQMQRTACQGRTIILVSHNMASIQHLCHRALWLRSGQVSLDGNPRDVVRAYMSERKRGLDISVQDWPDRVTNGKGRILNLEIIDQEDQAMGSVAFGGDLHVVIDIDLYEPVRDPAFGIFVHSLEGEPLLDLRSSHGGMRLGRVQGKMRMHVMVKELGLPPGGYLLSPWVTGADEKEDIDWVKHCSTLDVIPAPGKAGALKFDPSFNKYWIPSIWEVE
jgi:lipopolysaccharide transport system ATP-binding protein